MRSVYGPVLSRRFGYSLGIDATMPPKKCSFDCIYCQLGRTKIPVYEPTRIDGMTTPEKLRRDLEEYLEHVKRFDVVTFSGSGEPTANKRIKELIEVVRELVDKPVYMLTNASFLSIERVTKALSELDHVSAKLDAWDQESYLLINRPYRPRDFDNFLFGHKLLRRYASGTYSIQVMITRLSERRKLLDLAFKLDPDRIYVTVPYRRFKALMPDEKTLEEVRDYCREHGCIAFERRHGRKYVSEEDIQELLSRRPMSIKDIAEALGVEEDAVRKIVESMLRFGRVRLEGDVVFLEKRSLLH